MIFLTVHMWHMVHPHSPKQSRLLVSVGNESLEVESESRFESMMPSPESSPSLFVQRLESSQFAPQTRVRSSQFTYRIESSLD